MAKLFESTATDIAETEQAAAALFDLRLPASKKLLIALAVVCVFVVSYCLGRYSTDIFAIAQGTCEGITAFFLNLTSGCAWDWGEMDFVDPFYVASDERWVEGAADGDVLAREESRFGNRR